MSIGVGTVDETVAEASDLVPTLANAAIRAAECFQAAGDGKQAVEYAERAVKASPRRKEPRLLVAALLEGQGNAAGALAPLEIAATLDKSDGQIKKAIKRLSKGAK